MITVDEALKLLRAEAVPEAVEEMAAHHKTEREILGIRVPVITEMTQDWRHELDLEARLAFAAGLWESGIFEARIAAAKLLVQARIRPDDQEVWALITSWLPDLDCWALSDHLAEAGSRRLSADPSRLDEVEAWLKSPHSWTRRAALVFTHPWTKLTHPKAAEIEQRERILGWAAQLVQDRDWHIQKAIGTWIRDLSKRAPERAEAFLQNEGAELKSFARKLARSWMV